MMKHALFGAIEVGGTKIVCGVATDPTNFIATKRIPTRDPESNLLEIVEFFETCMAEYGELASIGIASFGPIDVDPQSDSYGTFLKTPKVGWSEFAFRKHLAGALSVPVAITTDVNGALLAEVAFGAAQGFSNAVYVTVGTGLGGGILVNGELVSGFMHPEIGHMRIPSNGVAGSCPFHGSCLEGLVCGPAIAQRAGRDAQLIDADDQLWDEVAVNLADMCINLLTILSTELIIIGGGVMGVDGLLGKIRSETEKRLAGYLPFDSRIGGIEKLIVRPSLGDQSGLTGALLLASDSK
jgi:fructokinase